MKQAGFVKAQDARPGKDVGNVQQETGKVYFLLLHANAIIQAETAAALRHT